MTSENSGGAGATSGLRAWADARPQLVGTWFAVMATLIWSGNFIAGRALVGAVPPATLVTMRGFLATLILLPFAWTHLKREKEAIRANFKYCALSAFLGVSIANTSIYVAAYTSEALNMSIIAMSTPLFILLMSRILFKERLSRTRIIGLLVTLTGVLLLVSRGDISVLLNLRFRPGDIFIFGNVIGFGLYTMTVRRMPKGVGMMSFVMLSMLLGTIFTMPGALFELLNGWEVHFSWAVFGGLLYVALGASILAYFTWNLAVSLIGSARTSIIYYLLPVFAGIEGAVFLGEPILLMHVISMLLIVTGLIIALHIKKKTQI